LSGYIILIIGAPFLITGISVSAIWTSSLVGTITHQNTVFLVRAIMQLARNTVDVVKFIIDMVV
jgi:hypothetical protein